MENKRVGGFFPPQNCSNNLKNLEFERKMTEKLKENFLPSRTQIPCPFFRHQRC